MTLTFHTCHPQNMVYFPTKCEQNPLGCYILPARFIASVWKNICTHPSCDHTSLFTCLGTQLSSGLPHRVYKKSGKCHLELWHMTLNFNRVHTFTLTSSCTNFDDDPANGASTILPTRWQWFLWPWPLTLEFNRAMPLPKLVIVQSLMKIRLKVQPQSCLYKLKVIPVTLKCNMSSP